MHLLPDTMIRRQDIQNIYALTPLQEGMLFHALHAPESGAYFEQTRFHITGILDVECFRATWEDIVVRHDVLRTMFVHQDVPEPLQIVLKRRPPEFHFTDLRGQAGSEQEACCADYVRRDRARGFDLTRDRLIRLAVFQCAEDSFEVVWSFHHILMDGWSSALIQHEFMCLYAARGQGLVPDLPPPQPFVRYVKWLEKQDRQSALAYWRTALAGYDETASWRHLSGSAFPVARPSDFVHAEWRATLPADLFEPLRTLARQVRVTLNVLMRTAWGLALCEATGRRDVVFGATVSGRPAALDGVERLVGLFINAIPVRVTTGASRTLAELARQLQAEATASQDHHYLPLPDVQGLTPLRSRLFDHILVFENYPSGMAEASDTRFQIDRFEHYDHTNYDLTVQFAPDDQLDVLYLSNGAVYDAAAIRAIHASLLTWCRRLVETPDLELDSVLRCTAGSRPPLHLAIAATFTAEPLAASLSWWGNAFGFEVQIRFAPYNQVFQSLLDEGGVLNRTSGFSILLIRLEDWLRDRPLDDRADAHAHLERHLQTLLDILGARTASTPCLVVLLPPSRDPAWLPADLADRIEALNREALTAIAALPRCFALDPSGLAARHACTDVLDPIQDRLGHIPYTDAFMAVLGTYLARQAIGLSRPPFKLIAVDCDNTLWRGICGEDGPTGVRLEAGHLALQRFLIEKQQAGFLLALCSKNNEADVWAVFDQHPEMLLRREHLVAWRIDWNAKSHNLLALAEELNIGANSLVFLDDSAMEIGEVMTHAPEILALHLPADAGRFPDFLAQVWAGDRLVTTREDRERSAMYQAEQRRELAQREAPSLNAFLAGLAIEVEMAPMQADDRPRVAQLTQRTNQFNLNARRRAEAEIQALEAIPDTRIWTLTVRDRFGDYGLTGVVIARPEAGYLVLDTLLLSCRVLGRRVEDALLHVLAEQAEAAGLRGLVAEYRPTPRNAPVLDFLQRTGWQPAGTGGDLERHLLEPACYPAPAGIRFEQVARHRLDAEPSVTDRIPPAAASIPAASPAVSGTQIGEAPDSTPLWTFDLIDRITLTHQADYLPLRHVLASDLVELTRERHTPTAVHPPTSPPAPPRTPVERQLVEIWQRILDVESVGIHDDFHALGGHSLKATRLISQIHRAFGVEIRLAEIFTHPTVAALAACLSGYLDSTRNPAQDARSVALARPIPRLPEQDAYPLSHAQRRLWVLQRMEPDSAAYNTCAYLSLDGPLVVEALNRTFDALVERHESLRTVFILVGDEPQQRILPSPEARIDCPLIDLSDRPIGDAEAEALRQATQDARTPFDLARGPLLRLRLFRLAPERHRLLMNLHHIGCDGWSLGVLEREFLRLYAANLSGQDAGLPPPSLQYRDFAAWQNARLSGEDGEAQRRYWLTQLGGEPAPLELPVDFPRPAVRGMRGNLHTFHLDAARVEGLRALCGEHQASLFMGLLATLKILLHAYTGQTDIVVGTPVTGREHPDLLEQVGLYVNTLALRDRLDPEQDFVAFLAGVRQTVLDAHAHQTYPFDRLVDELQPRRDTSRSPLFDVLLALQETDTAIPNPVPELVVDGEELDVGGARFDLSFSLARGPDGLHGSVAYDSELFRPDRIARSIGHLETLIDDIIANPGCPIGRLRILPADELAQVTTGFQSPPAPLPDLPHLAVLCERQAALTPTAIAVRDGDLVWTYAELEARAERLARHLAASHDIQIEDRIALCCQRSAWLVVGLLAILKTGAVYVPIDPSAPAARIAHIRADSGSLTLLDAERIAALTEDDGAPPRARPHFDGRQLAYVIYTSGSTGLPKGAMLEHRGFVNMIQAQIAAFGVTAADRVLLLASPAFDASLSEIFMGLLSGACLVPVGSAIVEDTGAFRRFLAEQGVSVATLPPVYLGTLGRTPLPGLRTLITAGESAVPADALAQAAWLEYFNAYGPTEVSVCTSLTRITPDPDAYPCGIPIGRPLPNLRVLLLDAGGRPVPIGVWGELHVAGLGLARGYLGRPELTRAAFVPADEILAPGMPDPDASGQCLYRTGDLARWRPDGQLEYRGRRDFQVKIRGYRVEPDEIAAQLRAHPSIAEAVVIPVPMGGQPVLAAFLVRAGDGAGTPEPTRESLRHRLAEHLPTYMIPGIFKFLDRLPRTSNDKLDREALTALAADQQALQDERASPPRSPLEAEIADAWQAIFGRELNDIHADFFDLGGDSIQAIQLAARLRATGLNVQVRDILTGRTVAGLAARLEAVGGVATPRRPPHPAVPGPVPLTAIQTWFFRDYPGPTHHFNQAEWFHCASPLDIAALEAALRALWQRHDALRMCFQVEAVTGEVHQEQRDSVPVDLLHVFDWRGLRLEDPAARRLDRICQLQTARELDQDPLLLACLFRQDDGDFIFLSVHHLVMDAVSWRIFLSDLDTAYAQWCKQGRIDLPPPTDAFQSWALAVVNYSRAPELLAEQTAWQALLADAPDAPWPRDCVPKDPSRRRLAVAEIQFGREATARLLNHMQARHGLSAEAVLLAGLAQALTAWHGRDRTLIMLEGHGREDIGGDLDVTRTIGWFTATFPFVLETLPDAGLEVQGRHVQERLSRLPSRIGYGILKYLTPSEQRPALAVDLKPSVSFNYLGQMSAPDTDPAGAEADERLSANRIDAPDCAVSPDSAILYSFDINAIVLDGQLRIVLAYHADEYEQTTIEGIMKTYRMKLSNVLEIPEY
jgi:amino acid adenylation domain-containing protein/FkbH-like protein/non-ribosomal peptide synthase protein (TIGR01720 family)